MSENELYRVTFAKTARKKTPSFCPISKNHDYFFEGSTLDHNEKKFF